MDTSTASNDRGVHSPASQSSSPCWGDNESFCSCYSRPTTPQTTSPADSNTTLINDDSPNLYPVIYKPEDSPSSSPFLSKYPPDKSQPSDSEKALYIKHLEGKIHILENRCNYFPYYAASAKVNQALRLQTKRLLSENRKLASEVIDLTYENEANKAVLRQCEGVSLEYQKQNSRLVSVKGLVGKMVDLAIEVEGAVFEDVTVVMGKDGVLGETW